ncbi:MAG: TldD/PmbA family protein [Thermoprotei archaeon]|nr:MAG: TldD/PmbA family protein [Thermoprotei archaeon]
MDVISDIIEYLLTKDVDFCDARLEERKQLNITVVNDEIRAISSSENRGISIRVLVNGAWGYASTTKDTWEEIKRTADMAVKMAKALSEGSSKKIEIHGVVSTEEAKPRVLMHPWDVSIEEKLDTLFTLNRIERSYDNRIVNVTSRYAERIDHFELANSLGSVLVWDEVRTRIGSIVVAAEAGRMQYSYFHKDGTVGFELIKNLNLEEEGQKVAKEAVDLLSAKKPPAGQLTVIADPSVAGVLAHEVMGHASEADEIVKRRSFLTDAVGKVVGSEYITMVDDGTISGAHGSIPFDSEGTPASRTVIIEKGVYKGYMHSLETAAIMDTEPTGNGRAQDFNRRIFVRMTNTFFEPGDWSFEEIIEDTKDGLLALKSLGGMEDPVGGGFQTTVLMGYIIRDGELKDFVREFTLSGKALEILKTVDAVSKEFELHGGYCGKGEEDWVPVSTGGPYLRAKILVGGG